MGLFAQFRQELIFTSEIFHHAEGKVVDASWNGGGTHTTDNGWVVGHGRLVLLWRSWALLDAQILHIAASEDDEVVDLVRRGDLLGGIALSALRAMRSDVL